MEFEKALSFKKFLSDTLPTHYNVESVTKLRLHMSNIVEGVMGRAEEV